LALKLDRSRHTCREVKSHPLNKLELIDERIGQLQLIRRALTEIAERCEGNDDSAESCLILKALENAVSLPDETA